MLPLSARYALSVLLLVSAAATAATPAHPLGMDYSEWFPAATQIATDTSGALYLLTSYSLPGGMSASSVTKLSADTKTILWRDELGFRATSMAVSSSCDVFVVPATQSSDTSVYVAKLDAAGSGVAWTASAGFSFVGQSAPILAADSQGRTYVAAASVPATAGTGGVGGATVVRLNASGLIDYTIKVSGTPTAIAGDGSGAVILAGYTTGPAGFVARLAPDGSTDYYTSLPQEGSPSALALDASGNAVVFSPGLLQRLNSSGAVTVSTNVLGVGARSALALDAAGNAYVVGVIGQLYPVRNSIATCRQSATQLTTLAASAIAVGSTPVLTLVAPDGSNLQTTYLPGAAFSSTLLLASGPGSTAFVVTAAGPGFVPAGRGPFPQNVGGLEQTFLLHLTPQSAAQTMPLACVGNAATYFTEAVAPGEIVTLIGSGLGPAEGIQTQASPQSPFPVQVSGVKVTFGGTPAPLLWVQDSQINAIVPWALTPGTNTEICVSSGTTRTNCLTWPVAQTAPAVFTVDGHYAAALNQDGSINSAANRAAPGSIVSVFATGLGPLNLPQADGAQVIAPLPSNVLQAGIRAEWLAVTPPFVSLVSAPLAVTYAGPAPYLVSGVSQIAFQIPPANGSVPDSAMLYLALPSTTSQAFYIYVAGQ